MLSLEECLAGMCFKPQDWGLARPDLAIMEGGAAVFFEAMKGGGAGVDLTKLGGCSHRAGWCGAGPLPGGNRD